MDLTEELTYIEELTERILKTLEHKGMNPLEAILWARLVLKQME